MNRIKEYTQDKKKKAYIMVYFYMVLILLIVTTVSSYAWLGLTRTPRVSNLSLYVNSYPGMEISIDPYAEVWTQQIKYSDMFSEEYKLRPATWSDSEQIFYGAEKSDACRLLVPQSRRTEHPAGDVPACRLSGTRLGRSAGCRNCVEILQPSGKTRDETGVIPQSDAVVERRF